MKAIEISSRTDAKGHLQIDCALDKSDSKVRVLILLDDETEQNEEKAWLYSISKNPAFEFLQDSSEDIYTLNDGKPVHD